MRNITLRLQFIRFNRISKPKHSNQQLRLFSAPVSSVSSCSASLCVSGGQGSRDGGGRDPPPAASACVHFILQQQPPTPLFVTHVSGGFQPSNTSDTHDQSASTRQLVAQRSITCRGISGGELKEVSSPQTV